MKEMHLELEFRFSLQIKNVIDNNEITICFKIINNTFR